MGGDKPDIMLEISSMRAPGLSRSVSWPDVVRGD